MTPAIRYTPSLTLYRHGAPESPSTMGAESPQSSRTRPEKVLPLMVSGMFVPVTLPTRSPENPPNMVSVIPRSGSIVPSIITLFVCSGVECMAKAASTPSSSSSVATSAVLSLPSVTL